MSTQQNLGVSSSNPSSIESLEQLNASTQSTTQTFTQQPSESSKNTPLTSTEVTNVLNAAGINTDGSVATKSLPFITTKTTQKLVTGSKSSGTPSAKPIVIDNRNLNLQPGLGIDGIVDVVLPFARAATIRFQANKLKPNTKYYAFFNEYNVTDFCYTGNSTANVTGFSSTTMTSKLESKKLANVASGFTANTIISEVGNIYSDYKGFVSGVFMFNPAIGLKVPSGDIIFRLTDSPTNGENKESFADAVYTSIGRLTRTTKKSKPSKIPDYGSGGNTPSRPGGKTNPSLPTPGKGDSSSGTDNTDYGWLEYHVAFLNNIPLSAVTNDMKLKAYADYIQTSGGLVIADDDLMKTLVPGAKNYDLNTILDSNSYNFISGNNASNKNVRLSDGSRIGDNKTAVNILEAVNQSTGKTFVQEAEIKIKSVGGDNAWKLAVGSYEGTKKQVEQAVKNNKLTPDMKKFWETGVKTGAFNPNNPADVQKAINNYAASTTLGMFKQASTMSQKASTATQANGTAPSMRAPTTTKTNSTATSTRKKR